jgi:ATP-dependent Clp protease ATP-binding subunit ClpC
VAADTEAKEWLLRAAGIDPSTGARPLRRTIQRHIQDAVSEILIQQRTDTPVGAIDVTVEDDRLKLVVRGPDPAGAPDREAELAIQET